MELDIAKTALLIIDVQMAFQEMDAAGRARSNPDGEANIARLLSAFREAGGSVIHIHHDSITPGSPFTPGLPGNSVQPFVAPHPGERTYRKSANSAFIGTTLEVDLRKSGIETLVMCGATANHCVETTARMGGNLGFDVRYVKDAVWAYSAVAPDGRMLPAELMHAATLANIKDEFGAVVSTDQVVAALTATRAA